MFGQKLKAYRQGLNMSVRELCEKEAAQKANLQAWLVRELELGSRLPQPDDLKTLAKAFGLPSVTALKEALDEAARQEARQRAAAKLKKEREQANPGKLVLKASNLVLNSGESYGLTDTQRIVDASLIANVDSFLIKGAQLLVDRAKPPEQGDLVLVMEELRTVGLGRLEGGVVRDQEGRALDGILWRVKTTMFP